MSHIFAILDKVIWAIEDIVSAVSLAAIVSIAFANVIARYFLHSGFLWADEVSQALLIIMGMFGCARAVRKNGHTQFDLLERKIKDKRLHMVVHSIIMMITLAFLLLLVAVTFQYTVKGTMLSTVLKIPRMYYYVSIPIGFLLCIYEYIRSIGAKHANDSVETKDL